MIRWDGDKICTREAEVAASVRIEDEAFSDRRYDVLAMCLGLPDADCARGKMASAWRQCTAQQTHTLRTELVVAILGPRGPEAVITAELGELVEGGIRIKGTKGRIEWLAKLRRNATKGGQAKAAKRQANSLPNGRHLAEKIPCAPLPDACPPAPAPAPVLKREGRARFVPPTVDEVRAYVATREKKIDPQRFVDHYTAKGWKVGKSPMKDWQACVRTWEGNRIDSPAKEGYSDELARRYAGDRGDDGL